MNLLMALEMAFDTGLKTGMSKNAYDKFNFWWGENYVEVMFLMGGIIALFSFIGAYVFLFGTGIIVSW
jgi:hypothetical protein